MYTPKPLYLQEHNPADWFKLKPCELPKPGGPRMIAHTYQTVEHTFSKRTGRTMEKPAPCWLSSFVSVRDHRPEQNTYGRYFELQPSKQLIDWIGQNNLLPDYDTVNLEIIIRDDGSMLVTANNSKILASRWLWLVDASKLDELVIAS